MSERDTMVQELFGNLDSMEHQVVEAYIRTSKIHRKVLERHLNKTGVYRSQHQLLLYIFCHPQVSQKELARLHNVSTAAIAVSLKKLEKGGYIQRTVDQEDNRFHQILITEKGKKVVEASVSFFRQVEAGMFSGFSREEEEKLFQYLQRIYDNIEGMLQKTESEGQNS